MKTIRITTLLISLLISIQSFAEIKEALSMQNIEKQITPGTLVIFDLDNTVLEAVQTLGTDQFFSFLVKKAESQGLLDKDAKAQALRQVTPIQPVSQVRLVENITKNFIKSLQENKYSVFALTARPPTWARGTLTQIASLGIDFLKTSPMPLTNSDAFLNQNGLYTNGVFFLPPGAEKGPTLLRFLEDYGIHANKIIFIDDKIKNVQSVEASLTLANIPNIAFRYGAADARVKAFDEKLAEFEYNYFNQTQIFLSDEIARKMMSFQITKDAVGQW